MSVIHRESENEKADWILLSRVFSLLYHINAHLGPEFKITSFQLEHMIQCVEKGLRQDNHMEMIDFFKFATFFSDKD
jgi:hypothetical protein